MKRNLLIIPALMVTAFFATTEIAKAADITFSGQMLTRYEVNEHGRNASNNFDNDSDAAEYIRVYKKTRKYLLDLQKAKIFMITKDNMRILFEKQNLEEYENYYEEYY